MSLNSLFWDLVPTEHTSSLGFFQYCSGQLGFEQYQQHLRFFALTCKVIFVGKFYFISLPYNSGTLHYTFQDVPYDISWVLLSIIFFLIKGNAFCQHAVPYFVRYVGISLTANRPFVRHYNGSVTAEGELTVVVMVV